MDNDSRRPAGRSTPAESDLFNLAIVGHAVLFCLRAPLRHPFIAALAFIFVMSGAVAGLVLFPQRYEVRTTILAGSPLSGALHLNYQTDRDAPTRAVRAIVLSRDNLEALVKEVDLAKRYLEQRPTAIRLVHGFFDFLNGKERDPALVEKSLVDTLEKRLWISVDADQTVSLIFHWWDVQIALDVVEAASQSFLEMRHAAEIKTVAESIEILQQHRTRLENDIHNHISAYEEREKAGSKDKKSPTPARQTRAPAVDPELGKLQRALEANQRLIAELETGRQQRIVQLQSQILQQQTVFAPDHPTLAASERMLESMQIPGARVAKLVEESQQMEAEIVRRGGTRRSDPRPESRIMNDPLPLLFDDSPRSEYERGQLRTMRAQLADIEERIGSAMLRMETAEAAFKHRYAVIAPPKAPNGPIKPYGMMFLVGGVSGGILLALLASVAADLRAGRVLERWQLEHWYGIPVLGRGD